jgi:hypothetical protein
MEESVAAAFKACGAAVEGAFRNDAGGLRQQKGRAFDSRREAGADNLELHGKAE